MADPQPVEARGRSCTGWRSTTVPPDSIRVGRANGRGGVEVVNFRRYVEVVVAREWSSSLPTAAIEAGAVAVKQYAWYHALTGNHRSSFRTGGGACFDVVDSTRDQLYKPELARVTPKVRAAVDATWGLSLRKGGRFFMTGYRSGSTRSCGADADGRRLYARSVIACARDGLSRQQIQSIYYGGNVGFVWAGGSGGGQSGDGRSRGGKSGGGNSGGGQSGGGQSGGAQSGGGRSRARDRNPPPTPPNPPAPTRNPPAAAAPPRVVQPPPVPPAAPTLDVNTGILEDVSGVSVSWARGEERLRYRLQQLVGDEWVRVPLPESDAIGTDLSLAPDAGYRFRVRAIDGEGLSSGWTTSASITSRPFAELDDQVYWMGNWRPAATQAPAANGSLSYSIDAFGASSLLFSGRSVSVLGTRGPGRGSVRIIVDGQEQGVVDLSAEADDPGWVVFAREWPEAGQHLVRVEPVTQADASAAPVGRVQLDAIVVYY